MRTKSFITSIIFFLLTTGLSILSYFIVSEYKALEGAETLALIVIIPMAIAFALVMLVLNACSIFFSAMATRSVSKTIMIISIILLVLSVALLAFNFYNGFSFITIFS